MELPQHYVCSKEEVLTEQQLCSQKRNSSLDQEDQGPPQIKEEQVDLCTSQDGEQTVLKQEMNSFMVTVANEKSDHRQPEPNSDQLLYYSLPVANSSDPAGSKHVDSISITNAELNPNQRCPGNSTLSNIVNKSPTPQSRCDYCTGKNPLMCDICGKTFHDNSKLKRHYRIHTGEKPFVCKTCGESFSQNSSLKGHMRTHTGEKLYLCNTCGQRLRDSSTFKKHRAVHTGEKLFACKSCGKSFSSSCSLKFHMQNHTGEKPYLCNTCGKRFSIPSQLNLHIRTHTGEKLYSCETCGKSFSQSHSLTIYVTSHTGEKPNLCNTCGKRFLLPSQPKRLTKSHTVDGGTEAKPLFLPELHGVTPGGNKQ
ncbi:zinc finger protein 664-like [Stegastes partitus]|uniref:Zinc finger protein 664-like n=1 Tax=Stegastes partitus TaxID=144197 RepID=A0A9Y4K0C9_9TELE|nr:PREDICTED: zinc finger protein 664-like [Stegastes partitus]